MRRPVDQGMQPSGWSPTPRHGHRGSSTRTGRPAIRAGPTTSPRDVSETRRASKFLDALPATPSDAPVALVALYRDNIFDTKVACVLAVALRLHGLRPVVSIPTNRASRVRRYVDAYRLGEVIAQDQLVVSPDAAAECADAAARLLDGPIDFAGIKDWEFRGQAVGNHVLSTLIRTTFDGSPDLAIGENRSRVAGDPRRGAAEHGAGRAGDRRARAAAFCWWKRRTTAPTDRWSTSRWIAASTSSRPSTCGATTR